MSPGFIQRNQRIIITLPLIIILFGFLAVISLFTYQRIPIRSQIQQEAQQEVTFVAELIKSAYLNKNYTAAADILQTWANANSSVVAAVLDTANGYRLVEYRRKQASQYTFPIRHIITHHNNVLFTIEAEKDITVLEDKFARTSSTLIIGVVIFLTAFGGILFYAMRRVAILPMEKAMRQQKLESDSKTRKLSRAVEQTDDAVVITNPEGYIEYVNPAFERMTGYSKKEAIGEKMSILRSGQHDHIFYKTLWTTILSGYPFSEVFINRKKTGELYYEEKTITPLKSDFGDIINFVSTGKDISDRMLVQEKLRYMATHDFLTGLLNRVTLKERLSYAIHRAARSEKKVAVMLLDLDKFKIVNDTLGHTIGDELIISVAERLSASLRQEDIIARLGGDEFTVIMEGFGRIEDVNDTANKILSAVSKPFTVDGNEIFIAASIGMSIYPDDDIDADILLKNADIAMYRAKSAGGGNYQYFTPDMTENALKRLKIHNSLQNALENREFVVYYQPKIDLFKGNVSGMEALIRWQNPDLGLVSPDHFINILEESGRIIEVGEWVMGQACRFLKTVEDQKLPLLRVSINLSARQFRDRHLLNRIQNCIDETGISPKNLELEITESLLVENIDEVADILNAIHNMGIRIDIDDFGTGYSSMNYLKRFPIDALKIDRLFIRDIPEDKDDALIVEAILAMAESLGIDIVAEGVETEEQYNFLKARVCHEAQGFLFGKPMPENEFLEWYRNALKDLQGQAKFPKASS
ncbi:MAG: EAL domain-containing protein [Gammaproteobacteria bacterium]|nr:EAL domain-containing protein [Gammaproteobacteria bacterium]MDH5652664.1 EAL domain-containing protein [Gammaproteobacteria bacterium]